MKAILEFDLNDLYDREDHKLALKGRENKCKLDEVWNQVFRPNNKHGYHQKKIKDLFVKDEELCYDLIEELAGIYLDIMREE